MKNPATGILMALTLALASAGVASAVRAHDAPDGFSDLVERLSPAVVNISVTRIIDAPDTTLQFSLPPGGPFEQFREFEELFRMFPMRPEEQESESKGSGFLINADGIIVTNDHVIEEADEIEVNFADGTSLSAEILGRDPRTDLAVLKVDAPEPLPFVPFGESDDARVGDWVLAIGNPFGFGGTVTVGIISAINRDINAGPYDAFIQTDAAINRGNSGGPLFNMDGEVIGVNSAIYSPSRASAGVAFAAPSAMARRVVDQILEFGAPRRGWLGVRISAVTGDIAEAIGMEGTAGALVEDVMEDSPAARGDIGSGDVILRFDGRDIDDMRDLPRVVADTPAGKTVDVEVFRDSGVETLAVTVERLDDETPEEDGEASGGEESEPPVRDVLGMGLVGLTPDLRLRYGIAEDVSGVFVRSVAPDGDAERHFIQEGDVIAEIARWPVTTPEEVVKRIDEARTAGRKSVLVLLVSEGSPRITALSLEDG